jgi:hypothetical protein
MGAQWRAIVPKGRIVPKGHVAEIFLRRIHSFREPDDMAESPRARQLNRKVIWRLLAVAIVVVIILSATGVIKSKSAEAQVRVYRILKWKQPVHSATKIQRAHGKSNGAHFSDFGKRASPGEARGAHFSDFGFQDGKKFS